MSRQLTRTSKQSAKDGDWGEIKSFVEVKPNSGTDLLDTWNAYGGEKIIKVPAGTYNLPSRLPISKSNALRNFIIEGVGHRKTIITNDLAFPADHFLIESDMEQWYYTNLHLRNVQLKGTGNVLRGLVGGSWAAGSYFPFVKTYFENVFGEGIFQAYSNPFPSMMNIGGSGASGRAKFWGAVSLHNQSRVETMLKLWEENIGIGALNFWVNSQVTEMLKFHGVQATINSLDLFVSPGCTIAKAISTDEVDVHIASFCVANTGDFTLTNGYFSIDPTSQVTVHHIIDIAMGPAIKTLWASANARALTRVGLYRCSPNPNATKAAPGVAYIEVDATKRWTCDLQCWERAKISVASAVGNEAGAGKGICIYDRTAAAVLCEVTWNGAASANRTGLWTDISAVNASHELSVYVKASSVTENITSGTVYLELSQYRCPTS